jgi:hypothetical protein
MLLCKRQKNMLSSDWLMPMVVLGLVVALLFAAAMVKRYQDYKAQQRATLRRVESAIPLIEQALKDLAEVPLSRNLRVLLRGDVFSRYQTIHQLHRRYPEIDKRLQEARSRMDTEGPDSGGTVPPIPDEQYFRLLLGGIDRLVGFFERGGPIRGQRVEERLAMLQQLKERRAETLARYHMVQANRYQEDGDTNRARQHLKTLIEELRKRGPNTDFVRELYQEAEQMQLSLMSSVFEKAQEHAEEKDDAHSRPSDAA